MWIAGGKPFNFALLLSPCISASRFMASAMPTKAIRNLIEIHKYFSFAAGQEQAPALRLCSRVQHVFNKYAVAGCWVIYQDVGHRTYQFAILDNRTAAHADVK